MEVIDLDYKKLYYQLFSVYEDVIAQLEAHDYGRARQTLILAQQAAEEAYLDAEEAAETKTDC